MTPAVTEAMAPDAPVGALVLLAVVGIASAALLSAGEAALNRLTRTAATELAASGAPRAGAVVRLAEHRTRALTAATFVRILAEMTAAVAITLVAAASLSSWWHVLLVAVAVTVLVIVVVIGASPRSVGQRRPTAVLGLLAPGMLALSSLAIPLERITSWARSGHTRREDADAAADELRDMVDRVSESEQIEQDEREMLQSVFELGRTLTREVMVPRTAMVTLASDATAGQAIRLFVRSGYSRVPVIGESADDVLGVLYLKDVLRRVQSGPGAADEPVAAVVREPAYVPETKPVDDLMREMQQSAQHIALVVDEFGGIAGLVTIEDCLEEIVGELRDEHDRAEPEVEDLGDGGLRVPARLPVDELGELFGIELHDDEVDSAGGLLAKALGKVPIPGAVAVVQGLRLEAERTEGRRRQVATLIVHREPAEEEPPTAERPAVDRPGNERTANDRPGNGRPENGRPGNDRSGSDRPGNDRSGNDRSGNDRSARDRSGNDRRGNDRVANDRPAGERSGSDRSAGDRSGSGRPATESAERAAVQRPGRESQREARRTTARPTSAEDGP